jgi:NitT/TauT family transport system substrate-binding protein
MAHKVMRVLARTIVPAMMLALGTPAHAADTIRLAVQKTGTFSWELATIREAGLDKEADLSLEVTELASPEAGKIALRAGNADIMLSDWL